MDKTYTINGNRYYQQELNLEQDEKISDLLDELDVKNLEDFNEMSINKIINLLLKKSLLVKLFEIILIPLAGGVPGDGVGAPGNPLSGGVSRRDGVGALENPPEGRSLSQSDIKKIPNSLAMEVVEDFFTLNAALLSVLKSLLGGLGGMKVTPTSQSTSPKEKRKDTTFTGKQKT
jgi:hypothetical protein